MQGLLAFFRAFREYLLFLFLCAVSIFLITHSEGAAIQVLRSYSLGIIASLQSSTAWVTTAFTSRYENQSLRDVNMSLMEEVLELRRLRQENEELRRLIGFRRKGTYPPLFPAEIIGKNFSVGQNTITIDAGENDSVRFGMPVINEDGLVGRVIATSSRYSIVQLAINRGFRATAKVMRSRVDGILAWKDGESLLLQNIWKTADVVVGDTVVTSEYSNVFPPDIPVGIIRSIGPGEGGLFSRIEVSPYVKFSTLERVFVIRYRASRERTELENSRIGEGEQGR